jgi:hypothetical protein
MRIVKIKRMTALVLLAALMSGGAGVVAGCRQEGPAERMGKDIDRAVEDAKDALNPPGPAEKAGKKLDRAVEDVTK